MSSLASADARTPQEKRKSTSRQEKKLIEKGDYPQAVLQFRNAVTTMPDDAEARYQSGRALEGIQEFQKAVDSYRKANELNPKHAAAQLRLAKILAWTADPGNLAYEQGRLQALLRAESVDPDALNSLALTELKLGKMESAIGHLEQSLTIAPQKLQSSLLLAQAMKTKMMRRERRKYSKRHARVLLVPPMRGSFWATFTKLLTGFLRRINNSAKLLR